MIPHPAKTKTQRAVLDEIGCGNYSPRMTDRTRDALLKAGLIEQLSDKIVGHDRFGYISIPQFQMPLHVHIQWSYALSDQFDKENPDGTIPD